jgi:Putative Ig domain
MSEQNRVRIGVIRSAWPEPEAEGGTGGISMRRSRRGVGSGVEFGSSGEDSFVAVVVTKLTGALLFILLLTMVIMALLPKVGDLEERNNTAAQPEGRKRRGPLKISTPDRLPEAIAGRPYLVALAATGGSGTTKWSAEGGLPDWLTLHRESGRVGGTPPRQTKEPLVFEIRVSDGTESASLSAQLVVLPYQSVSARSWKRLVNAVSWRAWLEQGVGFLVLWLVHLLGMNLLANTERGSLAEAVDFENADDVQTTVRKRFASYRLVIRLATLSAMVALLGWLFMGRSV